MFGWLSEARTFASRWNRLSRSVSWANFIGQDFDRDIPAELCVPGSIDLPHPAFADGLEDLVMGELVTACE